MLHQTAVRLLQRRTDNQVSPFTVQSHCEAIVVLCAGAHFSPWVTTEKLWIDIAKWAKNNKTVRETKDEVDRWQEVIQTASCGENE